MQSRDARMSLHLPASTALVKLAPVNTQSLKLVSVKFEPVKLWSDRSRFEKSMPVEFTCCSSVGSFAPVQ